MRNHFSSLKRAALSIASICFLLNLAQAQTTAENLQNGVEMYNALEEYVNGFDAATVRLDEIQDVKTRMDKGLVLMEKVIKEGNADDIRIARYFKSNFKYVYGYVLGMIGDNTKALVLFKEIERDMTAYSPADFPMIYTYFGAKYDVKWTNFAIFQAEYLTGYAENCYNLGLFDEAIRLNRLAVAHPSTTDWLKHVSLNKMLDIYAKKPSTMTEVEHLDFALQSIQAYHNLSEENKKIVATKKYPTDSRGVTIILDKALKNDPAALDRCGAAALAMSQQEPQEKVLQLFELSYRSKQPLEASFHPAAEAYARKAFALSPSKATSVGIQATDKMANATFYSDCRGLGGMADMYTYWKETSKAKVYTQKQKDCLAAAEKAQKKAIKSARRKDNNFNLYAGVYILPIVKSNAARDYGLALNFVFKKTAWEFSYLAINNNKENLQDLTIKDVKAEQTDLTRWDGYYAHIQPKFMKKNGYWGLLFGYAEKKFDPLTAYATDNISGIVTQERFSPTVKQYIFMPNVGVMPLIKGFGMDAYIGLGLHYSQWDKGNPINLDDYTVDNPVIAERKDSYFGVIMRAGLTLGLNFGRGNR